MKTKELEKTHKPPPPQNNNNNDNNKKTSANGQAPMAHTCNPSYSEGRNQEDRGLKPTQEKPFTKKGWWSGSRCRP
jgi:hypothetical protein